MILNNYERYSKKDTIIDIIYKDIPVLDYAVVENEIVFLTNDQKINVMDSNGNNIKTIIEIPEFNNIVIENLYADKSLIWFRVENTIYRFHRKDKVIDCFPVNEDLLFFKPLSNFSFIFDTYSEEWLEYLENGGKTEDMVDFNERRTFIFDVNTESANEYNEEKEISGYNIASEGISNYSSYSGSIKGKAIPYSKYPIGSYIREYSNAPCSHHTTTNNDACSKNGDCGCKVLGNTSSLGSGIQCNGFAKEIYGYLFGKSQGDYYSKIDTSTKSKAKIELMDLHPEAYIRADEKHSLILIKATATQADFYHANFEEACKVSITSFNYSDFSNKYKSLKVYDGLHYYRIEGNYQVCQYCGNKIAIYSA